MELIMKVKMFLAQGDPIDQLLRGSGDPRFDLWVARNDFPAPGNDIVQIYYVFNK